LSQAPAIIVGITGASGAAYGVRLLERLRELGAETHLVVTPSGVVNVHHELGLSRDELAARATHAWPVGDIGACIASGSFGAQAMVVAPCTMKSLAAIAHGFGDNLLTRAADVMLKERRRLVLMVRETPFNLAHLRNMTAVTEMGGVVFPPLPAFYNKPQTITEMVDAGYVRYIGLSEVGPETIRRAAAVAPIQQLQIEYSLVSRGIEARILPTVRELGISVTAYGVLSRGLLNRDTARQSGPGDARGRMPRFQAGNLERNLELLTALEQVAAGRGVTTAQLAFAWVLSRGDDIIPLIGTKRRDRLAESLGALDITLTPDELAAIEQAVPHTAVAGDRYDAPQMAALDSER